VVDVPPADRQPIATVIELTVDGDPKKIEPIGVVYHSKSLAYSCRTTASNTFRNMTSYAPSKAVDDDPTTRWATDTGTQAAWLEINLGKTQSFDRAMVDEPDEYQRIEAFELQYQEGQNWRTFHAGTKIGPKRMFTFPPVSAQCVRLNILKATEGPTLWEFQLFAPASAARKQK
jgi:alpha-L-fucosidase